MTPDALLIGAGTLVLAMVHLFAGKLRFLDRIPRSRWLSIASGSSVAYVFLHLLPELTEAQESLGSALADVLSPLEHHAYFVAAIGLTIFYGLERLAFRRAEGGLVEDPDQAGMVFWVHVGSFAAYNVLIGYILASRTEDRTEYVAFVTALALHFLVNDYGLRQHHQHRYRDIGRWVLSLAVGVGAVAGALITLPEPLVLAFLAFLAGSIVLNVLKEELPPERESRFWPFAGGMLAFGLFLALT